MIEVKGLSKRFKMYDRPADRLKEIVMRRSYHRSFLALDDVAFTVASGESMGILGKNGAGKSTLLKLLTGVLIPESGSINVSGHITGLLELGTGFDFELTGIQNITANALLLGMTPDWVETHREDIIRFSELGDFIREPLRTYSSGMVMRLAFSIAIHAQPACFVVDEALSVGDAHFQQKCMNRIREFRASGGSIVFVSHDLNAVKMVCDRALVLDGGRVVAEGTPEEAVNYYNRLIADLDEATGVQVEDGYGDGSVLIEDISLLGADSRGTAVSSGERAIIDVRMRCVEAVPDLSVGIMFRDRFGQDIYGANSYVMGERWSMAAGDVRVARFEVDMELAPGQYTLTTALHSGENHIDHCYHWRDSPVSFEISGVRGHAFSGVCRLPTRVALESVRVFEEEEAN